MRSVVVVLPASMCAMIPMLRVLWSENFRGIDQDPVARLRWPPAGKKIGPLGPTRAAGLVWTGRRRYLLEVSILNFRLRGRHADTPAPARDARPTIAEEFLL